MSTSQRFQHFDVLKGIAILLVVIGHAFVYGQGEGLRSPFFHMLVAIHMPLFVLISGYFASKPIDWSIIGLQKYWSKKVQQLLLPLFFLPVLYVLFYTDQGFASLLFDRFHAGYWFTYVLFIIFIIAFLYRATNRYINRKGNIWISLGLAGISLGGVLAIFFLLDYLSIYLSI